MEAEYPSVVKGAGLAIGSDGASILVAAVCSTIWIPNTIAEPFWKAVSLTSVLPAALLVTLGGLLLTKSREAADADEKRSLFYLESCITAYEEARNLLEDGNNDRATWIAAARALKHAQELSKEVSGEAHLRVLELHRLKYRRFFHEILWAKPAAFFYGAQNTSITVAEAAAASTAPEERAGRTVISTVKELSEKSLRVVWEAAQWPTGYQDPLDGGFSEDQKGSMLVLFPGLHEYLEHTQRYASAGGKLYPRNADNKATQP